MIHSANAVGNVDATQRRGAMSRTGVTRRRGSPVRVLALYAICASIISNDALILARSTS